jgi:hypothetical protein
MARRAEVPFGFAAGSTPGYEVTDAISTEIDTLRARLLEFWRQ